MNKTATTLINKLFRPEKFDLFEIEIVGKIEVFNIFYI